MKSMQDECKISATVRLTKLTLVELTAISQYAIHMSNILLQNTFSRSSQTRENVKPKIHACTFFFFFFFWGGGGGGAKLAPSILPL